MILTSIEKMAYDIGFDFAQSTDKAQSDFLNGLGAGFTDMKDKYSYEQQLVYINKGLTRQARKLITDLYEFIEGSGK